MTELHTTDYFIITRGDKDYKVTAEDLKEYLYVPDEKIVICTKESFMETTEVTYEESARAKTAEFELVKKNVPEDPVYEWRWTQLNADGSIFYNSSWFVYDGKVSTQYIMSSYEYPELRLESRYTYDGKSESSISGPCKMPPPPPPPRPWLYEEDGVTPWEGGIFHIKNTTETLILNKGVAGPFTAWELINKDDDDYGWSTQSIESIKRIDPGTEYVFQTAPGQTIKGIFAPGILGDGSYMDQGTWDFGHHTDISKIPDMERAFYRCMKFNGKFEGNWDTSGMIRMIEVFNYCFEFDQDISDWDTSNVINMTKMFEYCTVFNQDLSGWNVDSCFSHSNFDAGCRDWEEKNKPKFIM